MSTKYRDSKDIPTDILCKRINEIVSAITASDHGKSLLRECTMRIPAELDRDADLVLSEAARRLREKARDLSETEYQKGEFCKDSGCKLVKRLMRGDNSYCQVCEAYKFHDWLTQNGYRIVKRRDGNTCPHCGKPLVMGVCETGCGHIE
jgi:RNA polymerase subunit RPABC4/transcription elongation factor Spt4